MCQMRLMMLFLFLLGVTCDTQLLHCDEQDQSSLLRLKHDLVFDSTESDKLNTWNSSSDCCVWAGVTCRADDGHVIAIDLAAESISGGINDSNSPLFDLHHLQRLDLSFNNFSSTEIPSGIGKLLNLVHLNLSESFFGGQVPAEISRLTSLLTLNLYNNDLKLENPKLSGIIRDMTRLTVLRLGGVDMSAESEGHAWGHALSSYLPHLKVLSLHDCSLSGPLHASLVKLHSLTYIGLSQNNLSSQVPDFLAKFSNLTILDLSDCALYGKLPPSIFTMPTLQILNLIGNDMLSGTLPEIIGNTTTLTQLYLGDCGFSGSITHIRWENLENLENLALHENKLEGPIPTSIFNLHKLEWLVLSHNNFTGTLHLSHLFQNLPNLSYIDLSFNSLSVIEYLDLSPNFEPMGVVYAPYLEILDLSNNNFRGGIPPPLCNISRDIQPVIDLSNNSFSGTIPPCLTAMSFGVLNLKSNNLSGNIPNAFSGNCSLHTLDLSDNRLRGKVPKSMMNCKALEVINLGNNGLEDEFPSFLMDVSSLRVLVLRSNKFYGHVRYETSEQESGWSRLQIIDIAANNFSGKLRPEIFKSWTGMMEIGNVQPKSEKLGFGNYYQDTVVVSCKGLDMKLVKILTIFTVIDFSCNQFEGSIPPSVGDLTSLYALNLSHNRFTGHIPSSFGNLEGVESLDLANNLISGVIPDQLASLTFLSYANFSYNQLVGRIPTSTQLQSFSKWSYIGNKGLHGPPLEVDCGNECGSGELSFDSTSTDVGKEINWELICVEIGYVTGLGAVIGSLVFWRRWRFWFFERVDRLLFKVFPRLDPNKRNRRKREVR